MRRLRFVLLLALAACRREASAPKSPMPPPLPFNASPVSDAPERASLINMARGATVISRTGEMFLETSAANAMDGSPSTAWLNPPADFPQSLVIGLPARARIDRVGLRTMKRTDTANHVQFEASLDGAAWQPLATVTAAISDDAQWFGVTPAEAAFVRVTVVDPRPPLDRVRLYSALAGGAELEPPRTGSIEGCWSFNGRPARFVQRGAHVVGVVEIGKQPLFLDGDGDGRTYRFVWTRGNDYGLALMTVSADGKHLTALEWHEEAIDLFHGETWFGERGACSGVAPREDVDLALLRRVSRYSIFVVDDAAVARLRALLQSLRVPSRVLVHEFREATAQANKARAQQLADRLRAAGMGGVPVIAVGSDSPRQQPVTEAMRALYSTVDVEIPGPEARSGEGSPPIRR